MSIQGISKDQQVYNLVKQGLDASAMRNKVIANNIANINIISGLLLFILGILIYTTTMLLFKGITKEDIYLFKEILLKR